MNMRLNLRFKTVKGAVALSNDGIDKINSILDNDTSESESESENELSDPADISDDESDPADISDDESADFDNLLFSEVEEEEEEEEPVRRAGSRLVRGFIDKEAAVASPGSASGRKTKAADARMAREAKKLRYYMRGGAALARPQERPPHAGGARTLRARASGRAESTL